LKKTNKIALAGVCGELSGAFLLVAPAVTTMSGGLSISEIIKTFTNTFFCVLTEIRSHDLMSSVAGGSSS
jgi:hypothetical protein